MGEERKLILQMVAEGKITPEEADQLLEAIEQGERTAEKSARERLRSDAEESKRSRDLGAGVEQAVKEGLRGLEDLLEKLEHQVGRKLNESSGRQIWKKAEERIRRATEQVVQQAEERAATAAEGAARRAAEAARRAEKAARRFRGAADARRSPGEETQVSMERIDRLTTPCGAGNRLVVENRVGDITVCFYEGSDVSVEVTCRAWSRSREQAERRVNALQVTLTRKGSDILLTPVDKGEGEESGAHVRLDYRIQVPHGTDLSLRTQMGDLRVQGGQQVSRWEMSTQAGDIDIQVGTGVGFRYVLETREGETDVSLDTHQVAQDEPITGSVGDSVGEVRAFTNAGDIRLYY